MLHWKPCTQSIYLSFSFITIQVSEEYWFGMSIAALRNVSKKCPNINLWIWENSINYNFYSRKRIILMIIKLFNYLDFFSKVSKSHLKGSSLYFVSFLSYQVQLKESSKIQMIRSDPRGKMCSEVCFRYLIVFPIVIIFLSFSPNQVCYRKSIWYLRLYLFLNISRFIRIPILYDLVNLPKLMRIDLDIIFLISNQL